MLHSDNLRRSFVQPRPGARPRLLTQVGVLLALNPLIDVVNGYVRYILGSASSFSPGDVIRGLLLIYIVGLYARGGLRQSLISTSVVCFLVLQEIIINAGPAATDVVEDMVFGSKICFTLFLALLLFDRFERHGIREADIEHFLSRIVVGAVWISLAVLLSTLMGVSVGSYGSVGTKGIFIELNAVSAVVSMATPVILYKWIKASRKRDKLAYLAVLILVMGTALILGTKTPVIFLALSLVYYVVFESRKRSVFVRLGFVSLIGLSVAAVLRILWNTYIQGILARQYYFLHKWDIVSYLLSGRNLTAYMAFQFWTHLWYSPFIGVGWTLGADWIGQFLPGHGMIEMDFLDIAYFYGLGAELLFVCFLFPWLARAFRTLVSYQSLGDRTVCFTLLIGGVISIFGGHVLLSPLSCPYFVVLLALFRASYIQKLAKHSSSNRNLIAPVWTCTEEKVRFREER